MYRKDKIRVYVALSLLLIISVSYLLTNDKQLTGYISIGCMAAWLLLIFFLRRNA